MLSEISKGNVPWYFPLKYLEESSPSRLSMTWEEELKLRLKANVFIQKAGNLLGLPTLTQATGIVLLQRFFSVKSFVDYRYQDVGLAAIFLAGKKEETFCHVHKVVYKTYSLNYPLNHLPDEKGQEISKMCKDLITLENDLLHTISFELEIDHPYGQVVDYIKKLHSDKRHKPALAQAAWNFINDCYTKTIFSILYPPNLISSSVLALAAKFLHFRLPMKQPNPFWEYFNSTKELVEKVSKEIQKIYKQDDLERIKQSVQKNSQEQIKNDQVTQINVDLEKKKVTIENKNENTNYILPNELKSNLEFSFQPSNDFQLAPNKKKSKFPTNEELKFQKEIELEINRDLEIYVEKLQSEKQLKSSILEQPISPKKKRKLLSNQKQNQTKNKKNYDIDNNQQNNNQQFSKLSESNQQD
ncbi:cyclin [Anaeramoeba flamelloides]|uniref:Cyclin n=1 Tax=Anaeramoeba flamelloides TaxID=1746091 RepID=A0ABQ8Y8T6_9EUKA|nr:cyclin [Anaeramoeba flamelloides]